MTMKQLTQKELEALKKIRNHIAHYGEFPSMRKLMAAMDYNSPRSAAILISQLLEKGFLERNEKGKYKLKDLPSDSMCAQTIEVPLIGTVACGAPILAEQNIEAKIPVSEKLLKPGNTYFILRASGDSMNKAGINDGDFVLVRQTVTANNGDRVVALVDNASTIKEFHYDKGFVILKPCSTNEKRKPIILTNDFQIQGVVVTTIPNIL